MAACVLTPTVRPQSSTMNKQQDSDTETVHTDIMNKHLTVLMRDYEREVAKWTFVYGMMSKQQQTEFQEWKTEQQQQQQQHRIE